VSTSHSSFCFLQLVGAATPIETPQRRENPNKAEGPPAATAALRASVLRFQRFHLRARPLRGHVLVHFARVVVEDNQVPSPDTEARQVLHSLFGVVNVLVHNKRCTLRVRRVATERYR
jgi:hypothetical protein